MEYVRLGPAGTRVSRIWLGCMTFGAPDRGRPPWTASKLVLVDDAVAALELGLCSEETALPEAPSVPHAIAGQ